MVPDIISVIQEEIASDDYNQSARIFEKYEAMTDMQKYIVNDLLMDICGWSLDSLVKFAEDRKYFVEE